MSEFTIKTIRDASDTLDLRYGLYTPAGTDLATKKRYVVFLNGRTEWIEKYHYLPRDLNLPADCGFLTWDHRGQGASGGARSYVDSYDSFAQDAGRIIQDAIGDKPYVIMAHSMGGLISLYATLKGHIKPQSMVLSSPLLGLPEEPLPGSVAKPIAKILSLLQLGTVSSGAGTFTKKPFVSNPLTHHAERYECIKNTPYPIPGATFGWIGATFSALQFVFDPAALKMLKVPTLVMGGTKERVVNGDAFRHWVQEASKYSQAEAQLRLFQGAKHELFSEIPQYYNPAITAVRSWFKYN